MYISSKRLIYIEKVLGKKLYDEYEYLIMDSDFCKYAPLDDVKSKLPKIIKSHIERDNFDDWAKEERKYKDRE